MADEECAANFYFFPLLMSGFMWAFSSNFRLVRYSIIQLATKASLRVVCGVLLVVVGEEKSCRN